MTNTPPAKLASSARRKQLKMSTRSVVGEQPAVRALAEELGQFDRARDRRMHRCAVGLQPGGVRDDAHLAEVGRGFLRQGGEDLGAGRDRLGAPCDGQVPELADPRHVHGLGARADGLRGGVVDEVVLARLAAREDLEAELARPGHELDEEARLVAVHRRVDEPRRARLAIQHRADHRVGLLGREHDVLAVADSRIRGARRGLGVAGRIDQHVERQLRQDRGVGRDHALAGLERGERLGRPSRTPPARRARGRRAPGARRRGRRRCRRAR